MNIVFMENGRTQQPYPVCKFSKIVLGEEEVEKRLRCQEWKNRNIVFCFFFFKECWYWIDFCVILSY